MVLAAFKFPAFIRAAVQKAQTAEENDLVMASSLSAFDLSKAPVDVITLLLEHMDLQQRFTCALVCSEWAKAAAAVALTDMGTD